MLVAGYFVAYIIEKDFIKDAVGACKFQVFEDIKVEKVD